MWRVLLLAVLVVVACKPASDDDDFPVVPGGSGPGGTGTLPDAPEADALDFDALQVIVGRVCLVADLRALTTCAAAGAGGLTVTLGTSSTTTTGNGAFAIMAPSGTNLVWRVTGLNIVKSVMAFGPSNTIPTIDIADYVDLQNANSVTLAVGEGSIVARIVRNGVAQNGVVASVSPLAQFPTKYDGITAIAWTELATSTAGTAWIPGAALGTNAVTATPLTGTAATESVLVEDQAITYATIELP